MRIVAFDFMSLDGVVQAPGGAEEDTENGFKHGGWSAPYFDPEVMGTFVVDGLSSAGALLFGRRTWQGMAAAWPGRAGDPYADRMNSIKKYVVSSTLAAGELTWNNSELIPGGTAIDVIAELRASDGGDIHVWGSAGVVESLLAEGMIDELNLMIEPILLGGGKRIFPTDGAARPLELVHTAIANTGVLICTYRPAG
jgi:dihydrofolate reductase